MAKKRDKKGPKAKAKQTRRRGPAGTQVVGGKVSRSKPAVKGEVQQADRIVTVTGNGNATAIGGGVAAIVSDALRLTASARKYDGNATVVREGDRMAFYNGPGTAVFHSNVGGADQEPDGKAKCKCGKEIFPCQYVFNHRIRPIRLTRQYRCKCRHVWSEVEVDPKPVGVIHGASITKLF